MKNTYKQTDAEKAKEAQEYREAVITEAIKACVRLEAGKRA